MKVLLIIDNLGSGGAQNQITLLGFNLAKLGYQVGICTYNTGDFYGYRFDENNVLRHTVAKKGRYSFKTILDIKKIIESYNYEVVISYMTTPNFYGSFIKFLSSKKYTLIISHRTKTVFNNISIIQILIRKFSNIIADHIVCNSYHERQFWINNGVHRYKISTIYNIVDTSNFIIKKSYDLKRKLLVVGKVRPLKNAEVIVEAVNILNQEGESVSVTWYGEKTFNIPAYNEYVSETEQKIVEYNLQQQWVWKNATTDLPKLYHKFDCLIHASLLEGLPNVICEALASGCPVIASNLFDHPILLDDEKNGLLFDPLDPKDLAKKIKVMYRLSSLQRQLIGQNAIQFAAKNFNINTNTKKYINLF